MRLRHNFYCWMNPVPFIPESAPFSVEQRAWLNGFLAGLHSNGGPGAAASTNGAAASAGNAGPLLIGFGSQTGTAEGLAKKIAKEATQRGFAVRLQPLNDLEAAGFAAAPKVVIVSSTWGDGDAPDNAANFWNWLKTDSAPRLETVEFAVLGLGDKNYSDFCGASKKFDARLEALGAKRLVPRGECDTDYEAAAQKWMDGLWAKLGGQANGAAMTTATTTAAAEPVQAAFGKAHPFPARLLKNLPLNQPGSAKEVRHYEIALGGSGLSYAAGDALGVLPTNCDALVGEVLAALGATGDEPVSLDNRVVPLRLALAQGYELGKPTAELLAETAKRSPECELASLLAPDKAEDLKRWLYGRDVLDILRLAPGKIFHADLIPLLRKLSPRLYSISSSPKAHPGEVHLTVGAVRYEKHGRSRKGVASTFLADRAGDIVRIFVQPSHGFRPPATGEAPMIMVGPGTGIAPFRAFLEDRQASGATGKNWLFFGDQKRATDFLYAEQLTAWHQSGFLTRLELAFSRDQAEKIYVQDADAGKRRRTVAMAGGGRAFLRVRRCQPHGQRRGRRAAPSHRKSRRQIRRRGEGVCREDENARTVINATFIEMSPPLPETLASAAVHAGAKRIFDRPVRRRRRARKNFCRRRAAARAEGGFDCRGTHQARVASPRRLRTNRRKRRGQQGAGQGGLVSFQMARAVFSHAGEGRVHGAAADSRRPGQRASTPRAGADGAELTSGYVQITTRANLQMRLIQPKDAPEFLRRIQAIGLHTRGAGGDNIRNLTMNPTAGIDPVELIDVKPLLLALAQVNHP